MARPLRLQLAGATYLVTARATSPELLFRDEQGRAHFIKLIARSCQRYRWRCHAWCLGNDYYQLLIATERPNLAAGMRYLNSVHSQTLQRRQRLCGPLFDGRYSSVLVDPSRALFAAAADLLSRPVVDGLVEKIGDWRWSSYHTTCAPERAPEWLATGELLRPFDDDPARAGLAFAAALASRPRRSADRGDDEPHVYAQADYIARLIASAEPAEDDDCIVLARLRLPLQALSEAHPDRREAMRVAYRAGYSQKEIARYFNVHTATVSRAVAAGASWSPGATPLPQPTRYAHE